MNEQKKIKWLIFFYGADILETMQLDEILRELKRHDIKQFITRNDNKVSQALQSNLDYLVAEGYLKAYQDANYSITQKGRLILASGGFTTDAKKNKNALYAFRISILSLTIALISFIISIINKIAVTS